MKKQLLLLLIPIFIFSYFILRDINLPYVGPNATNFTVYSLIAHNFNKFGYMETKFAPVISVAPTLPQNPEYFFHHPTLLSFIESLLFKTFGEDFWVGRLSVIIFAFGSLILTYFIGKHIENKQFALLAVFLMAIIPASTLFGKMIGQESLVLFFCLLSLYGTLKFLQHNQVRFLILIMISVIFGVWSDWPATFFIFCLFPLFLQQKKIKTWIALVGFSGIVVGSLFFYVYVMKSSFGDLQNALALRSFTGLFSIPLWPLRWLGTTFSRLLIYFNPVLLILALWYVVSIYKMRTWNIKNAVILSLLGFALLHLLIYAQATFTHPYLLYYFLPFVVFASASQIRNLWKEKLTVALAITLLCCLLYLFIIQNYKSKQIENDIWRYEFTKIVSGYLTPYEYILSNPGSAIDSDMMWYPFLINMKGTNEDFLTSLKTHKHYVFSCINKCDPNEEYLKLLMSNYHYNLVTHPNAEAYIFLLQRKKENTIVTPDIKIEMQTKYSKEENNKNVLYNTIKDIYKQMVTVLHLHQL